MSAQGWIVCWIVAGVVIWLLIRLSRNAKGGGGRCCGKDGSCCSRKDRS